MSDIDLVNRTILLAYHGSKTRRQWVIPMHDDLASHLKKFIERTEAEISRKLTPDDFLFDASRFYDRYTRNPDGGMSPEAITGFFKRLTRNSGVSVGAHRFRHTLATSLCNPVDDTTPDIFAAQAILGHTSLQTTRGYVQTSIVRMDNALKKIGRSFRRDAKSVLDNCEHHA